jgi:Dolichyl-phosphate-mannose-protein mannosyltransferase
MKDWKFIGAVAALALIAAIRVASTHRVFSATLDEPIHIAASHEWLVEGTYTVDVTHPTLTRWLFALPLRHLPAASGTNMIDRGNQLLYEHDRYEKHLARARLMNLPLLFVAIFAVAFWARRHVSRGVAILAAAIYSSVPVVLGHAGLATTDLAVAAALPLALLALEKLLDTPSIKHAVFSGFAVGVGVLSKFSFLIYFPVCAIVILALRRKRVPLRAMAVLAIAAFVVVWGGYRFDVRTPAEAFAEAPQLFEVLGMKSLAFVTMPAPALPAGFARVRVHDLGGHTAFLLGETSRDGWWYYFPVVFFFKTPIALLVLFLVGARRSPLMTLCCVTMMLVAMTASLNIGVRHVMPMYAPFAVAAAVGASTIKPRFLAIVLLLWFFIAGSLAHPDSMAYFNEAALPNPAHVAVDSNLDWGQDILRLARVVKQERIEHIHVVMNFSTRLDRHGINATWLRPGERPRGWIAVGENWVAFTKDYDWLKAYKPVRRIGKSIRLYHID